MPEEKEPQNIVRMEDILNKSNGLSKAESEKPSKKPKKTNQDPALKGMPKSGRFWKSERKKFSSINKTKGVKMSLEKKRALKEKLQKTKEASREIKTKRLEQEEERKERRRNNLKRQEENRKKSEIVQVITNTKKLKKMKKKQLRHIEKRDTTVVQK